MSRPFSGKIATDIRDSEPDWGPFAPPSAPAGAPNVLYIVWDDIGIAAWDGFGGLVEMPNMARIADRGVRLNNTIVVVISDNGASGEGGPNGSVNDNKFFNGFIDTIEDSVKAYDHFGG